MLVFNDKYVIKRFRNYLVDVKASDIYIIYIALFCKMNKMFRSN